MRGRRFLDLAEEVFTGGSEVHRRGAVGRAYYALMLECRDALLRWGFKLPPRDNVHTWVRLRLTYAADPDLKIIGLALDTFGRLRNQADYDLSPLLAFRTDMVAKTAIREATDSIALLDAVDADAIRRARAIVAIQTAFP
jgi:hypothetical protein